MHKLLNATEVAHLLGVSLRTFDTLIARQEAPLHMTVGRQRRWRAEDVSLWIAAKVNLTPLILPNSSAVVAVGQSDSEESA